MATLAEQLKKDLMECKRQKDFTKSALVSVIIGEVQRLPNKSVGDDDIIKIIKKLHKLAKQSPMVDDVWVGLLEQYMPPEISEDHIKSYIKNEIDMTQYEGNKRMKLIGVIMKYFDGKADGNVIRKVLENI